MRYLEMFIDSVFSHWPLENGDSMFYQGLRDTGEAPIARTLYGMLECALGYTNDYPDKKAKLEESIEFTIESCKPENEHFNKFYKLTTAKPLFCLNENYLCDTPTAYFQTRDFPIAKDASIGAPKAQYGEYNPPAMTKHAYIINGKYKVRIIPKTEYGQDMLDEIEEALHFPKYIYYYGDRKCIPSTINIVSQENTEV